MKKTKSTRPIVADRVRKLAALRDKSDKSPGGAGYEPSNKSRSDKWNDMQDRIRQMNRGKKKNQTEGVLTFNSFTSQKSAIAEEWMNTLTEEDQNPNDGIGITGRHYKDIHSVMAPHHEKWKTAYEGRRALQKRRAPKEEIHRAFQHEREVGKAHDAALKKVLSTNKSFKQRLATRMDFGHQHVKRMMHPVVQGAATMAGAIGLGYPGLAYTPVAGAHMYMYQRNRFKAKSTRDVNKHFGK